METKGLKNQGMDAQQIINESESTDFEEMFYPEIALRKKTDPNITKCLREVKI